MVKSRDQQPSEHHSISFCETFSFCSVFNLCCYVCSRPLRLPASWTEPIFTTNAEGLNKQTKQNKTLSSNRNYFKLLFEKENSTI